MFVLKKLLTFFENLIVPHALHCIDGRFFCILPHLTVWHTVLVSNLDPSSSKFTRELKIRVKGLYLKVY